MLQATARKRSPFAPWLSRATLGCRAATPVRPVSHSGGCYAFFAVGAGPPLFLASAHRFFIAKASFLRPSSERPPFFVGSGAGVGEGAAAAPSAAAGAAGTASPLALAQRAFAAAASFARWSAEILRFFLVGAGEGADARAGAGAEGTARPWKIAVISVSRAAIFSAISTARFN